MEWEHDRRSKSSTLSCPSCSLHWQVKESTMHPWPIPQQFPLRPAEDLSARRLATDTNEAPRMMKCGAICRSGILYVAATWPQIPHQRSLVIDGGWGMKGNLCATHIWLLGERSNALFLQGCFFFFPPMQNMVSAFCTHSPMANPASHSEEETWESADWNAQNCWRAPVTHALAGKMTRGKSRWFAT